MVLTQCLAKGVWCSIKATTAFTQCHIRALPMSSISIGCSECCWWAHKSETSVGALCYLESIPLFPKKGGEAGWDTSWAEFSWAQNADTEWYMLASTRVGCTCCLTKHTSIGEYIWRDIWRTGDAEAHGIASLLTKYNTVACIYMLSDVLHTVAKLQGSLQGKEVGSSQYAWDGWKHYPTTEAAEGEYKQQYIV